jgi:hypothetical protein
VLKYLTLAPVLLLIGAAPADKFSADDYASDAKALEGLLPPPGKYHPGPVSVRAGSMGEGLAVGFMALGKPVCGGRMAGLMGWVYDFDLPKTGLRVKFPAERIYTVAGAPREKVVLSPCR